MAKQQTDLINSIKTMIESIHYDSNNESDVIFLTNIERILDQAIKKRNSLSKNEIFAKVSISSGTLSRDLVLTAEHIDEVLLHSGKNAINFQKQFDPTAARKKYEKYLELAESIKKSTETISEFLKKEILQGNASPETVEAFKRDEIFSKKKEILQDIRNNNLNIKSIAKKLKLDQNLLFEMTNRWIYTLIHQNKKQIISMVNQGKNIDEIVKTVKLPKTKILNFFKKQKKVYNKLIENKEKETAPQKTEQNSTTKSKKKSTTKVDPDDV